MTKFIYKGIRFGGPFEREFDSAEDALDAAVYDFDYNEASPHSIEFEGRVVYDRAAILKENWRRDD